MTEKGFRGKREKSTEMIPNLCHTCHTLYCDTKVPCPSRIAFRPQKRSQNRKQMGPSLVMAYAARLMALGLEIDVHYRIVLVLVGESKYQRCLNLVKVLCRHYLSRSEVSTFSRTTVLKMCEIKLTFWRV